MAIKYFSYGSNMSASYLKKFRNVKATWSTVAKLDGYKFVMNMPGPNFVEPGFGNIMQRDNSWVEGMLHEISDDDFKRILLNFYSTANFLVGNNNITRAGSSCKH